MIGSSTTINSSNSYKIGDAGKYFIKGLIDDPVNPFFVYLFTTDINRNQGTFGVFKMDFTPASLKYVYTDLLIGSG